MLVGKQALDVPDVTRRLCDLYPVMYHLIGARAMGDLYGISDIPQAIQSIRELLAAGSVLDNLVTRFVIIDRERTQAMERAGKALIHTAGVSSHLLNVVVPGGVRAAMSKTLASEAEDALEAPAETAVIKEMELLAAPDVPDAPDAWMDTFDGLDVTVVDADGELAPLGNYLAVARHHTDTAAQILSAADWPTHARESRPGDVAPRPMLDASKELVKDGCTGQWEDLCQVGPVFRQVAVDKRGISLCDAQRQFLANIVAWARRVFVDRELLGDHVCDPKAVTAIENADFGGHRSGIRMIDGLREPLVHRYTAGADDITTDCQIMTLTVQNKP